MHKAPGRLVTLRDNRVCALQGTKKYVEGIALEMTALSKPAAVRAAGQKLLNKIVLEQWKDISTRS